MSKEASENLFLLEFLVDSLQLAPQCECASPPGETCVAFSFLDNQPLEICEEDFVPAMRYGQENAHLKSGKSCLFTLTSEQISKLSEEFEISVSVMKKMQPGWLPDRIQIGSTQISISNLFIEMLEAIEESTSPESSTSQTLKDVFAIFNTENVQVGKIGVFIRMSCFGKLIVTQFQMNFDDKSVLFKDKEGKSLYRYKKAPKGKEHKIDDIMGGVRCDSDCPFAMDEAEYEIPTECPPECPGASSRDTQTECPKMIVELQETGTSPPCVECTGKSEAPCVQTSAAIQSSPPPLMGMGYQPMGMMTPCIECGMLPNAPCLQTQPPPGMGYGYGSGAGGFGAGAGGFGMPAGLMGCSEMCEGIQHLLPPQSAGGGEDSAAGNYQEIGATLGTNKLTIRVHKNSKIEPVDANTANVTSENQVAGGDSCTCCPGAAAERRRRRDEKAGAGAGSIAGGGVNVGIPNTQAFNVGLGVPQGNSRLPFSFKMGCAGPGGRMMSDKNVIVQPPTNLAADGTQFTEISDPNKDLFILRIGKKSEGVDKKNNLELELCTPRAPDYKPPPKQETRDTQFDERDASFVDVKKKGGKGGKKDKKGKKGKK